MRVLLFTPLHPTRGILPEAAESIGRMDRGGHRVTVHREGEGLAGGGEAYDQITRKYQYARSLALMGGFDALMTVEYDNIIPPDALTRLAAVDADVAYGLYCCRRKFSRWLAFRQIWTHRGRSYSAEAATAAAAWGRVVESQGVGFGCTLIHRRVLERVEMRRMPGHPAANDWQFALDVGAAGLRQAHDCGCVVGHIVETEPTAVLWPIGDDPFFRVAYAIPEEIQRIARMSKRYRAVSTIWHSREQRYYGPGEEMTLTPQVAEILLAKKRVVAVEEAAEIVDTEPETPAKKGR